MNKTINSIIFFSLFLVSNKAFSQNTLQNFISEAFLNSPLLKINDIQSQANQLKAEQSIAALKKPIIAGELNYMLSPIYANGSDNAALLLNPSKNVTNYYGYDLSSTNGGLFQSIVTFDQPLFNKQRIEMANQQMALQNEVLGNNSRVTKHDIERLVTEQYVSCLQDLDQQKAIIAIQKIIAEQISILQKLSANGLARQSDYKLLQIELNQQQSNLQSAKDNYRIHLLNLYTTCGIGDTATVMLEPTNISLQGMPQGSSGGFTRQFTLDSLNLEVDNKLFNTKYRPMVSLYSSAGLNAVQAKDIYRRFGWEVGVKLTKTFFDGNQKKLNESRTRLLQQETNINNEFFNRQNTSRKSSILQLIQSINSQTLAVRQQINDYDSLLIYYQKQIINAQSSVIDYITILRSRDSLQLNLVSLHTNRLLAINNYNYWNW